jgi:NAD(P)-dependent dehydrogenase (short-subunit alcohol dehydrogenase family)
MGMLDGKVALVTGAGTGIGKGIATLFAAEGAKVLIAARREEKLLETVAEAPDSISHVVMDLCDKAQRERALATAVERYGKLDCLVNNAGNQYYGPFMEMSDEDVAEVYATNLTATTLLIKGAVPLLRQSGGNVINISSTAGRYVTVPSQLMVPYSASRAGTNQLTRTMAVEFGPMGIRVNAVAPGLTYGEVSGAMLLDKPDAPLDMLKSLTPLGRIGQPIDIARVCLFLASELAGWVTGQIIDASGGWQTPA